MNSNFFIQRTNSLYFIIILFACVLVGKLIFVQLVHGETFSEKADRQYVSPIQSIFDRGSIYFKDKNGELFSGAMLQTGYTIGINPSVLEDTSTVYTELSHILPDLDKDAFYFKAGKKNDPHEIIYTRAVKEQADAVLDLSLSGVFVEKEKWRFYPREELAAHVMGFVGYKGESFGGRYGVERYYDDTLLRDQDDLYVNFFAEVFSNIEQTLFYKHEREGDVVLAIEPEVQQVLEDTLKRIMSDWDAKHVGGIIINPKDGSLYALGARPTFNPNTFRKEENISIFSNPLVENVYEFGSIVKALTMAVGIDSEAVEPTDTYNDAGYVVLNGARIENYDGEGRGVVSLQEVLNQSLNTGAVHIMQEVGKEEFAEYFRNLELGKETGIDLPGEVHGLTDNLKSSREIELATVSFGQGIATTPIAMVRALSSLANKGVMLTPHVGYSIQRTLLPEDTITFGDEVRVFNEETTQTVTRMLVEVVDEALLGGTVALPRYSVAAKTGTAQIAKENGRGYYEDRFLHSFFGYFPAYDPEFLVFLYTVDPHGARYASQTLTYPFMDTVKFLINYYNIPPDR